MCLRPFGRTGRYDPMVKAVASGAGRFVLEFESGEELREEHRTSLAHGGLRLPAVEKPALFSKVEVTLRGPLGAEVAVAGTVVAPLPDGVALAFEGNGDAILEALLAAPPTGREPEEKDGSNWDRLRGLSRTEKLLLAPKADRTERLVLVQDNDPQVLYSLLNNPRISVDEEAGGVEAASGGRLSLVKGLLEKVADSQRLRVPHDVGAVHHPGARPQDPEHVGPLSLRVFSSEAIPLELREDDVLR